MTGPLLDLADYARLAQEKLDPAVWDFVAGGAGDEVTLAANDDAFARIRLRPSVLRAAARPDLRTTLLGRTWDAPIGVAPMAFHTLAHPDGESATVRGVAATASVPVTVATLAGRSLEQAAAGAGGIPLWFQLYCFRDREVTRRLVGRAEDAGYEALVLTVDAPRLGRRLRDVRNAWRIPAGVEAANLRAHDVGSPAEHALAEFDPDLDWSVVDWLASLTDLPILLKGVLRADDARRAVEAGAAGVVVSNHGGRQLDGAPATLEVLPEVAAAVAGRVPVLLDGGIRRGRDVLAALALGADAVLLGRPVLHGLAAGGEAGVAGVLRILLDELVDAMTLCGVRGPDELGPELIAVAPGASLAARPGPAAAAAVQPEPERLPAPTAPTALGGPATLPLDGLHGSVADPVMDTMNFLNEVTLRYPQAISFAPGRPYDGFYEFDQVFDHLHRYLDHLRAQGRSESVRRDAVFQYGPATGQIRELIADSLRADEGVDVPPESIVVTVGCQEAMVLVLRALVRDRRDVVLVSSPCYVGITGAAALLDVDIVPVEERAGGLSCADVEAVVRAQQAAGRRVRAVYVIPDHSNPSGSTISLPNRHALLELAARHDLLLLEDSPYRLVSAGPQLPTLKSLDHDRRVVHLGSYSKTVFPGARLGFAVADQLVSTPDGESHLLAAELGKIKSMITVNTSSLSQAVVAGALLACDGRVSELNAPTAAHYARSMQTTLEHLDRAFPPGSGVHWNRPEGGFFLSLTVPFAADNDALARCAEDFGVLWTPMSYFYPGGGGERGIRLSVSSLSEDEIGQGIGRLAQFVKSESARS